jgi:hypothetical protein
MSEQRYTLALPTEIYDEIKAQADRRGMSIKELVRQCLKFGLVAIKLDEEPNTDLFIKERVSNSDGSEQTKETRLKFVW